MNLNSLVPPTALLDVSYYVQGARALVRDEPDEFFADFALQ